MICVLERFSSSRCSSSADLADDGIVCQGPASVRRERGCCDGWMPLDRTKSVASCWVVSTLHGPGKPTMSQQAGTQKGQGRANGA